MAKQAFRTTRPFNTLFIADDNARSVSDRQTPEYRDGIEKLAASIFSQGLLQNLVIHMVDAERGAVDAGGRRYDALALLVERGSFPADHPVDVLVIDADDAVAASLTENVQREAMHPADEFEAFKGLVDQGWTMDRIADSFGVTVVVVERRLKLLAAAPALLEEYRARKITTDQLIALCSTDDHELQVQVWNNCKHSDWSNTPKNLRHNVLRADIEGDDARVAFIGGVEVYEKAGGRVRRDLFGGDGSGAILEDASLLDRLVDEKLQDHAQDLASEGWGWVEVMRPMDWSVLQRYGSAPHSSSEVPEHVAADLAELKKELGEVEAAILELHQADDELTEEESERLDALYDRSQELPELIQARQAECQRYSPEVMKLCGGMAIYDRGTLTIKRGLVRSADRQAVTALLSEGQSIYGGRETEPTGRRSEAMSDALRRSLLGHRNLAAQFVAANNVRACKVLMVCKMVSTDRHLFLNAPTDFGLSTEGGARTCHPISDEPGQAKADSFGALGKKLVAELPTDGEQLWDAVHGMKDAELDALLAYTVARSVSLRDGHSGITGKFLDAMSFNMVDHFEVSAANYLGRVPKSMVIDALVEAGRIDPNNEDEKAELLNMKKGELASRAEQLLAGSGWVPEVIRTPAPAAKKKAAARKPAAKKP